MKSGETKTYTGAPLPAPDTQITDRQGTQGAAGRCCERGATRRRKGNTAGTQRDDGCSNRQSYRSRVKNQRNQRAVRLGSRVWKGQQEVEQPRHDVQHGCSDDECSGRLRRALTPRR
jgi:hypothetical protein